MFLDQTTKGTLEDHVVIHWKPDKRFTEVWSACMATVVDKVANQAVVPFFQRRLDKVMCT